jgi:hypothetical protein
MMLVATTCRVPYLRSVSLLRGTLTNNENPFAPCRATLIDTMGTILSLSRDVAQHDCRFSCK